MVLDSSACLDIVLDSARGRSLYDALLDHEPLLSAPGLLWVEVGRVLRAKAATGDLSLADTETAFAGLADLGVEEVETAPLLARAWQWRDNITVDDGVFVALAEASGEPLMTTDLRLATAARTHAGVDVITDRDV